MIEIQNVSKVFGEVEAVKNVSLHIDEGELFGLLGPDGAGKSTFLRMVNSLMIPSSGTIDLWGLDPVRDYKKVRFQIGYMPGKFSLYPDLTIEENLNFFATVFGTTIQENYHLIKDIYQQIEPFKNRRAGRLSGGMKQKLALSCALIHKPKLLVLDEPTTGVDAVSRAEFWEMLKNLKEKGITIIVSTPYMDEASMCDRVALMQNGAIHACDRPVKIVEAFNLPLWSVKTNDLYKGLLDLRSFLFTHHVYPFGEYLHWISSSKDITQKEIEEYLIQKGNQVVEIKSTIPDVEDCFIELTRSK